MEHDMKRILTAGEKDQIKRLVDKVYVHTPEEGLIEFVTQKLRRALRTDPTILAAVVAHALVVHRRNQKLFADLNF
jgi:hypothetical protein